MSIFGDLDTDAIPDDPFYVAPNTYWALCTKAEVKQSSKDDKTQLVIEWTIDEPASDYHGRTRAEYYTLYPGRSLDSLNSDEKQALSWLKRRLRRGFDLSESEIKSVKPSDLISRGAFITLKENEGKGENAGRKFVNVFDAVNKRLWEEENGSASSMASSMGL